MLNNPHFILFSSPTRSLNPPFRAKNTSSQKARWLDDLDFRTNTKRSLKSDSSCFLKMVRLCTYWNRKSDSRFLNYPSMTNRYGEAIRFYCFSPKKRQASKALKRIQACHRSKDELSILSLSYHQFAYSLHHVSENGPSEQWSVPLTAGISKENREKLERSYQKALGRCLWMQMGLICEIYIF